MNAKSLLIIVATLAACDVNNERASAGTRVSAPSQMVCVLPSERVQVHSAAVDSAAQCRLLQSARDALISQVGEPAVQMFDDADQGLSAQIVAIQFTELGSGERDEPQWGVSFIHEGFAYTLEVRMDADLHVISAARGPHPPKSSFDPALEKIR